MTRERIGFRTFQLPLSLEENIHRLALEKWSLDLTDPSCLKALAEAILKMSDFYAESPEHRTPWDEKWCQQAHLCYFLPLNYLRNLAVISEGMRFGFFDGISSAMDFGAGLGAAGLALNEKFPDIAVEAMEVSKVATSLREQMIPSQSGSPDLLICSYSLTENNTQDFRRYQNLMLIEPSTIADARRLQELRQKLIDQGFSIWAPCTHQLRCPLLVHSERDWCHDRIHFQRPEWFLKLERVLPIKNENLTFSYLLASKRPAPGLAGKARMTGDYLAEKGKARQLFCRGEDREYLSMLARDGELTESSRGTLIEVPPNGKIVGSEYRISSVR